MSILLIKNENLILFFIVFHMHKINSGMDNSVSGHRKDKCDDEENKRNQVLSTDLQI